jgi:hypothetical protein
MSRALLDFPWPVKEAFDPRSACFGALFKFQQLTQRFHLTPVPFLSQQELDAVGQGMWRHSGAAAILRFINHCVRHSAGAIIAKPMPEPDPPLDRNWKQALREELEEDDWRRPQIVVSATRTDHWPHSNEISIVCEDRAEKTYSRVLVRLDEYVRHPFAITDFDPWLNPQHHHPPGANPRTMHPCVLPRPLEVSGVSLVNLAGALEEARRLGWKRGAKYCFIPPTGYDPAAIDQQQWRKGRGFEWKRLTSNLAGPIDYKGQVWAWDSGERHWDVQLVGGGYMTISHDGTDLRP